MLCSFSIIGDYKYIKDLNWLDCILRQYSIQAAVNFTDMIEEQIYTQLKEIHKKSMKRERHTVADKVIKGIP